MKYLSFDIEATGLRENDLMIEFACVPFDSKLGEIAENLSFHRYLHCPSYETLLPSLDEWVAKNNKELITTANAKGIAIHDFKKQWEQYLTSSEIKSYFQTDKIVLFGKSVNAIDLPFLNRDLGWQWMRNFFSHRVLDFSSVCHSLIDCDILPAGHESGSKLMNYFGMGEVLHTALEDAVNTAYMYLKCVELVKQQKRD